MRLKPASILAILVAISITTYAADIIGPTCRKIPTEISPKLDAAYDGYYKSLCSHGCQPVVVGKYTRLLSDKILKPAVNDISRNVKMEQNRRKSLLRITDETMKAVEANCGQMTKKVDFCKNTKAFPKYAACAKRQILSVIMSNAQEAGPLLNENACRKELEYLKKRELWEENLPSYVKNFVDSCRRW
ncbi:hypothetical protein VI817_005027 [Penicillium citrinum]|uniref:Uncharacterized protein n=1 Tax=Penicillium hetheringtonii TaxID=911720 RepID=A0AAD6DV49_9EURO|nr:hypothetical protein N7450_002063 [Penicillium hetheringtonii]KAK5798737.1 hypothetical protein VI817_005027 [Penicillium citrinum]